MRSDPVDAGMPAPAATGGMSMNAMPATDADNDPLPTDAEMASMEDLAAQPDSSTPAPSGRDSAAAVPEELISIKQEALQELLPLVSHLDQSPEEKFRITMMMIQANDNQGLIPQAYDAAKAITDEKARAQALLDVVNEINYFTAQNTQKSGV